MHGLELDKEPLVVSEQLRIPYDWEAFEPRWTPDIVPLDVTGQWAAGYDYGRTPTVFGRRRGRGPLIIAWDTDILIDYLTHGRAMWNEDNPPDIGGEYRKELIALQVVVTAVFPFREVAIWVSQSQIEDARRALSSVRKKERAVAIDELLAALSLTVPNSQSTTGAGPLTQTVGVGIAELIKELPDGHDQLLVGEALAAGCHVFLTRDKGILRHRDRLAPQIALLQPATLVDALALSGELRFTTSSVLPEALVPDLQRLSHLIASMGDS